MGGGTCRDHYRTLKITHPSLEASLGLNKRALKDLALPKRKSLDPAPTTISSGPWEVRNYVNLCVTDAQCSQGFSRLGEHNFEVNITSPASKSTEGVLGEQWTSTRQ